MYFRKQDKALLSADGELLRRFHCPQEGQDLHMVWEDATSLRCRGCQHRVRMAYNFTENQLKTLLEQEPGICLLIPKQSKHITFQDANDESKTC